jgi:hypothetical protein
MLLWFLIILGVAVAASRHYNAPRTKVAHLKATGLGVLVAFALILVVRSMSATTPEASEALANASEFLSYATLVVGAAVTWLFVRRRRGTGPTVAVEVVPVEGVDVDAWTAQYATAAK